MVDGFSLFPYVCVVRPDHIILEKEAIHWLVTICCCPSRSHCFRIRKYSVVLYLCAVLPNHIVLE